MTWSQYPLRRASSWRAIGDKGGRTLTTPVSIPSQAGILLAAIEGSQHRTNCHVSIPSQAGILLAERVSMSLLTRRSLVSIPSQAGILLADLAEALSVRATRGSQYPLRRASSWRGEACSQDEGEIACLNTLSGGHPLGGSIDQMHRPRLDSLNTLSGGHPLGGRHRADSADMVHLVSIPSQAGILLAGGAILRWILSVTGLNTLSGGHPLGGQLANCSRSCTLPSQYPLRRASSWRRHDGSTKSSPSP